MPDFDPSVPRIARAYRYWLGAKDNFAADRELGEQIMQAYPNPVFCARSSWSNPAWSRNGDPTPSSRRPSAPAYGAAWPASPEPHGMWC
jgi:hypothetical protein